MAARFEKPRTLVVVHATPAQAHQAVSPQQQLRGDGEEMPFAGHALELVSAAVFKLES
jgi:hypothetical protein